MSRSAEQLLEAVLEREWIAQSGATRPLVTTAAVREAFELTVSATRRSVLDVAALLPSQVSTPQVLLERMRPVLPAEVDAWAERLLERLLPGDGAPDRQPSAALVARREADDEHSAALDPRFDDQLATALDPDLASDDQLATAPAPLLDETWSRPPVVASPGLRPEQVPPLMCGLLGALLGVLLGVLAARRRR